MNPQKKKTSSIKGTAHSLETATGTEEKQRGRELEGFFPRDSGRIHVPSRISLLISHFEGPQFTF